MIDQKVVELIVQAQLKGGKDLEGVTKAIAELEAAIDKQTAAAKRGETSIDELKGSLEALRLVQRDLNTRANLVGNFQKLGEAIARTEGQVTKATQKFNDYRAKVAETGDATKEQQATLDKYSAAIDRASARLEKQQATYAATAKALQEAGIATNDLAAAEAKIRTSALALGTAFEKVQGAVATYAQDVRAAREAERALADEQAFRQKADDAARLARSTEYVQFWTDALNKADEAERSLADERAFQKKADDAAKLNKASEYVRWWSEALDKADAAERRMADDAAFQKKADDAAKLAKSADYVQWWADALNKADAAQERLKADNALRKTADDAEAAAKGYVTLANASDNLRPKTVSLRDAVNAIINPAENARSTLGGVEQEVNQLAASIAKIRGPVNDYKARMESLAQAQRALTQQAGLIDTFTRQNELLRAAKAEFAAARAQVAEYAAGLRQGGAAGEAFVKPLAEAQVRVKAAAQAYQTALNAYRQGRDALQQAGIATNRLAAETDRLTKAAKTAATATTDLSAAVTKYGTASDKASRIKNPFSGEGGRTTLSLLQRIRGEVLALTSAYVGLFGVIGTAQASLGAARTRDATRSGLSLAVGNNEDRITEEYKYLEQQADRVGISFEKSANSYSKFAVSATKAGRTTQETRFIFETFIETARVLSLSGDQLDGLFTALTQSFSKGKIAAEELRGQIGERLPGAFAFAQEALKDVFPNLDKALAEGKVGAEQLVVIAESVRRAVQDRLPKASKDAAAAQERFNNELFRFQLAIADSGFLESYTNAIQRLTQFLASDEGRKAAEGIGKGFAAAADALVYLLNNLDQVKTALQVVGAYFGIALGASVIRTIGTAVTALQALWAGASAAVTAIAGFASSFPALFALISRALGALSAFIIGWQIGTHLNEKYEGVRKFGVALVTGIAEMWARIKGGFEIAMAALPGLAQNAFIAVLNTISTFIKRGLSLFSLFAKAAGADELAKSIDAVANSLKIGYVDLGKATEDARRKMEQEVQNIRGIRDDMMKAAEGSRVQFTPSKAGGGRGFVNPAVVSAGVTAYPGRGKPTINGGDADEKGIQKRKNKIEEIQKALETLDARIDRSQTETLAKQLSAIDTQYAALARKIKELGGKEAKELMNTLTTLTNEFRKVTTDKFNENLLKEQRSLQNKLEDLDAAAGRKDKLSLQSRTDAIRLQYQDLYRELADLRLKFFNNDRDTSEIDAAKKRLDSGIEELVQLEQKKFAQEEINREQERYNKLIELRDAKIAAERAKAEADPNYADTAAGAINNINAEFVPQINAATDALIKMAEARRFAFATDEDFNIFIQRLIAMRAQVTSVTTEFTRMQQTVVTSVVNGVNSGLNTIFDSLEQIATGQASVADGFRGMLVGFAQFAAQFLREIAIMILKQMIFNALQNSGNPYLAAAGRIGAGVKHGGGVIGQSGGRTRMVNPAWFANAPRYHSGGLQGLRSDEYATILQRGEEVLAADSPRNIMNGGAAVGGGGQSSQQGLTIALVDDRRKIPEAMNSSEGDQVIVQSVRRNASMLRQILKG